jgi:hypothetical protein
MSDVHKFSSARAAADQIIRDLRAADEGLAQLCEGTGADYIKRLTLDGTPILSLVPVTRNGVIRQEWRCRPLGVVIAAVIGGRVRAVHTECGGEGCPGCIGSGFVPVDNRLAEAGAAFEIQFA